LLAARIPKIHLHCHLEGTLRGATFVEFADKHGVALRYRPSPALRMAEERPSPALQMTEVYSFDGLGEFLYLFAAVSRSLREPQDYARLAREFVEDALRENVIYGELFVSPSVWTFFNPELNVREVMEAIVGELRAAQPDATFRLLTDLTRNFGVESAMAGANAAAAMTDLDVIGIGLGGDEARFPAALYAEAFAFARAAGLHCVAHAGESGSPQSVRDAVEQLGAQRIGHGIAALLDPGVVDLLARKRVPLEICPTSNRLTGAQLPEHPQPYADLDRLGCIVTIDADDPAIFETTIGAEYALVEHSMGSAALERFVRNAIEASFASPGEKAALAAQVDRALAELRAESRS
jgi:adenosine deaminase